MSQLASPPEGPEQLVAELRQLIENDFTQHYAISPRRSSNGPLRHNGVTALVGAYKKNKKD
jgi:hypothetical protein